MDDETYFRIADSAVVVVICIAIVAYIVARVMGVEINP